MKKYYVNYLPIEVLNPDYKVDPSNIVHGTYMIGYNENDKYEEEFVYSHTTHDMAQSDRGFRYTNFRPLILCVFSTDLKVGDKVFHKGTNQITTVSKLGDNSIYWVEGGDKRPVDSHVPGTYGKLIGRLSQGAIWVRRYDTFDEEEIALFGRKSDDYKHLRLFVTKEEAEKHGWYDFKVMVKCSQCQALH